MFVHRKLLDVMPQHDDVVLQTVVDVKGAARILGLSESYLNKLRAFRPSESPRFLRCGRRVLYRIGDLKAWQDARLAGGCPVTNR